MSADGAPLILYVADAGESFAEASLSATHYHCDAIAETDATVLALPKADLLTLMTTDPVQAVAFALTLASQVRDLRTRLELRNVRSAKERGARMATLACERRSSTRIAAPFVDSHRRGVGAHAGSGISCPRHA